MSFLKRIAIMTEKQANDKTTLNSKNKMLFYGEAGKSTIAMSYSMTQKRPVYVITAAGGSHNLSPYFKNTYVESLNDLDHLSNIIENLESEYRDVLVLRDVLMGNDPERVSGAESYYRNFVIDQDIETGEDVTMDIWERMHEAAMKQELPFSAIVVEEINIITGWLYSKVGNMLKIESVVGDDKSKRGFDWNIYEKEVLDLFTKLLKLPCAVFFSTADRTPTEQQTSNQTVPDICSGKANRKLQQMIGNVFFCYKEDKTGLHKIQLVEDKKTFAKDKIIPPFSSKRLDASLDLTGRPQYFWEYIAEKSTMDEKDLPKETKF